MYINPDDLVTIPLFSIIISTILMACLVITFNKRIKLFSFFYAMITFMQFLSPSIIYRYVWMNGDNAYVLTFFHYLLSWLFFIIHISRITMHKPDESSFSWIDYCILILNVFIIIITFSLPNGFSQHRMLDFISLISIQTIALYSIYTFIKYVLHVKFKLPHQSFNWWLFSCVGMIIAPYFLLLRTPIFTQGSYRINFDNTLVLYPIRLFNYVHWGVLIYLILVSLCVVMLCRRIKKQDVDNTLYTLAIALIVSDIMFNITKIGPNLINFRILPNTPCAIFPWLLIIFLKTKNELIKSFLILINMPLLLLSPILLFTGESNNVFHYFTLSSLGFHIYGFLTAVILIMNCRPTCTYLQAIKSSFIFLFFQLLFLIIGNIQEQLESALGLNLSSGDFYGFLYQRVPFKFLDFALTYEWKVFFFRIYPLNTLIIWISMLLLSLLTLTIIKLFSKIYMMNLLKNS